MIREFKIKKFYNTPEVEFVVFGRDGAVVVAADEVPEPPVPPEEDFDSNYASAGAR